MSLYAQRCIAGHSHQLRVAKASGATLPRQGARRCDPDGCLGVLRPDPRRQVAGQAEPLQGFSGRARGRSLQEVGGCAEVSLPKQFLGLRTALQFCFIANLFCKDLEFRDLSKLFQFCNLIQVVAFVFSSGIYSVAC